MEIPIKIIRFNSNFLKSLKSLSKHAKNKASMKVMHLFLIQKKELKPKLIKRQRKKFQKKRISALLHSLKSVFLKKQQRKN